ncbi:hypothetical protein SNEBB_007625 [Seison nebaliae]|nr:hypothetical protein SNEBB_007625 [Seison nebaliae]
MNKKMNDEKSMDIPLDINLKTVAMFRYCENLLLDLTINKLRNKGYYPCTATNSLNNSQITPNNNSSGNNSILKNMQTPSQSIQQQTNTNINQSARKCYTLNKLSNQIMRRTQNLKNGPKKKSSNILQRTKLSTVFISECDKFKQMTTKNGEGHVSSLQPVCVTSTKMDTCQFMNMPPTPRNCLHKRVLLKRFSQKLKRHLKKTNNSDDSPHNSTICSDADFIQCYYKEELTSDVEMTEGENVHSSKTSTFYKHFREIINIINGKFYHSLNKRCVINNGTGTQNHNMIINSSVSSSLHHHNKRCRTRSNHTDSYLASTFGGMRSSSVPSSTIPSCPKSSSELIAMKLQELMELSKKEQNKELILNESMEEMLNLNRLNSTDDDEMTETTNMNGKIKSFFHEFLLSLIQQNNKNNENQSTFNIPNGPKDQPPELSEKMIYEFVQALQFMFCWSILNEYFHDSSKTQSKENESTEENMTKNKRKRRSTGNTSTKFTSSFEELSKNDLKFNDQWLIPTTSSTSTNSNDCSVKKVNSFPTHQHVISDDENDHNKSSEPSIVDKECGKSYRVLKFDINQNDSTITSSKTQDLLDKDELSLNSNLMKVGSETPLISPKQLDDYKKFSGMSESEDTNLCQSVEQYLSALFYYYYFTVYYSLNKNVMSCNENVASAANNGDFDQKEYDFYYRMFKKLGENMDKNSPILPHNDNKKLSSFIQLTPPTSPPTNHPNTCTNKRKRRHTSSENSELVNKELLKNNNNLNQKIPLSSSAPSTNLPIPLSPPLKAFTSFLSASTFFNQPPSPPLVNDLVCDDKFPLLKQLSRKTDESSMNSDISSKKRSRCELNLEEETRKIDNILTIPSIWNKKCENDNEKQLLLTTIDKLKEVSNDQCKSSVSSPSILSSNFTIDNLLIC